MNRINPACEFIAGSAGFFSLAVWLAPCLKATYILCTYTIFGPVIVSLHVIFVVPPGAAMAQLGNSCHFIFSTRARQATILQLTAT